MYIIICETDRQPRCNCMRQGAQGWCTGMTQRDGLGREVGGGYRMGNTCKPRLIHINVWQKPLQYCKVISLQLKLKKKKGMKTDLFQSCGHCWVFQICWHIECSTFTAPSFRIWNSSIGILSRPLALFVVMLPKVHLTLHSRMSESRCVITP